MNKIFNLGTQNYVKLLKKHEDGRKQKQHHHTRP